MVVQVAYAHKHGVVHRDIKPESILVGPFGVVLLLDWSLAEVWKKGDVAEPRPGRGLSIGDSGATSVRVSDAAVISITGQDDLQCTVTYMSPEQLRRAPPWMRSLTYLV